MNPQAAAPNAAELEQHMRDFIKKEKEMKKGAPLDFVQRPDGVWELEGIAA